MMVGPCNYQLIGLVMIPYHAAVGNRQVTATAAATAACKCEGWGVLRVPADFGCQWLARWALLTNEKHIQYRTGRHTYSTTQFANQILIAYKLDMTQWLNKCDNPRMLDLVHTYTHTMVTRCTTRYHWWFLCFLARSSKTVLELIASIHWMSTPIMIL